MNISQLIAFKDTDLQDNEWVFSPMANLNRLPISSISNSPKNDMSSLVSQPQASPPHHDWSLITLPGIPGQEGMPEQDSPFIYFPLQSGEEEKQPILTESEDAATT